MAKSTAKRSITLALEPLAGGITMFYSFVDAKKVIQADGTKKRSWTGTIEAGVQVKIKVRVFGIDDAEYKLTIDLPGTSDDQSLDLKLTGGYHEIEITI